MFVSEGNAQEYNELLKLSIEDYLIRFKIFIEDLDRKKQQAKHGN